jgi:hypothetical protein
MNQTFLNTSAFRCGPVQRMGSLPEELHYCSFLCEYGVVWSAIDPQRNADHRLRNSESGSTYEVVLPFRLRVSSEFPPPSPFPNECSVTVFSKEKLASSRSNCYKIFIIELKLFGCKMNCSE